MLSLLLLQAIPVLHFFADKKEIFYTYIDEEKPDNNAKEKKYGKEYLSLDAPVPDEATIKTSFFISQEGKYQSPLLEAITPPPNLS